MAAKKLTLGHSFKLMEYIEKNYSNLNVTDAEFASVASHALGFDVAESHVLNRRQELGIKSTKEITREKARAEAAMRQAERAERVARMQQEKTKPVVLDEGVEELLKRIDAKIDKLLKVWNVQ